MLARKKKQTVFEALPLQDPDEKIDLESNDIKEHEQAPGAVVDEIKETVRTSSRWIWVALLAGFCLSLFCLIQFGSMKRQYAPTVRVTQQSPLVDPEACGNAEEQWRALVQWAQSRGGWIHPGLSSGVFEDGVRGLVARGAIEANRTLMRMPESTFINLKTVAQHPLLGPVYRAVPEMQDGLGGLLVFLIHEALNRSSAWRPFLCTLPPRTRLPMFLTPKTRDKTYRELVGAEASGRFASYVRTYANETWAKYGRVMSALTARFPERFPARDYSTGAWAWAAGVVFSRSWSRPYSDPVLAGRTGRPRAAVHTLVPAMDMPNHHPRAKLPKFVTYRNSTTFTLNSYRSYKPGEQVFITYGSKCNDELLATYGFVLANNSQSKCKDVAAGDSPASRDAKES